MKESAQTFFEASSLLTLGSASVAVLVVSKTVRTLLKVDSPWPAFVISTIVCFVGAISADALVTPVDYLIAILNSCLLFCTALGMNEITATKSDLTPRDVGGRPRKDFGWRSSWIRRTQ